MHTATPSYHRDPKIPQPHLQYPGELPKIVHFPSILGFFIRKARERQRVDIAQICQRMGGMSPGYWSLAEEGKYPMEIPFIFKVSDALRMPYDGLWDQSIRGVLAVEKQEVSVLKTRETPKDDRVTNRELAYLLCGPRADYYEIMFMTKTVGR